jgi:hypothetical protein
LVEALEGAPSTSAQGQNGQEGKIKEEGTDGEVGNHGEETAFYPVFSDTEESEMVIVTPRTGGVGPRRMSI